MFCFQQLIIKLRIFDIFNKRDQKLDTHTKLFPKKKENSLIIADKLIYTKTVIYEI